MSFQPMYAKVFAQIFDSSIADNYELRHFFMDLLVLADIDGVVDMTITAIAARTRIPVDKVHGFIAMLEAPDTESRSPEAEGRRIKKLDEHRSWGWMILNYDKFRKIASEEQRREKTRERTHRYREVRELGLCDAPVTHGDGCDAMQKQKQKQKQKQMQIGFVGSPSNPIPTLEQVTEVMTKHTERLPEALKSRWAPADEAESFIAYFTSNGWKVGGKTRMKSWQSATVTWRGNFVARAQTTGTARQFVPFSEKRRAIEEAIARHPANRESSSYNSKCPEDVKAGLRKLREQLEGLNQQALAAI